MRPITRPYQIRENFERACDFTMFKIIDFERQAKAWLSLNRAYYSIIFSHFRLHNSLKYVTLCHKSYYMIKSTTNEQGFLFKAVS